MMQSSQGRNGRQGALARLQAQRKLRQGRRSTRTTRPKSHWQQFKPWLFASLGLGLTGIALLSGSIVAAGEGWQAPAGILASVGITVFAVCIVPLILGTLRIIDPPPTVNQQRCGRCSFYQASAASYAHGLCAVEALRRATTSAASCPRFEFSERAMVREKLSEAPHILNSHTEA